MKPTVLISVFLCLVTLVTTADAQLFRNAPWNRVRTQSNCPGGICPTSNATRTVVRSNAHWTYPGTIEGHLQSTHGMAVTGMSREQMLSMHDAIHEGRAVASPVAVQPVVYSPPLPKAAPPPKPVVQSLPSGSMFGLSSLNKRRRHGSYSNFDGVAQRNLAAFASVHDCRQHRLSEVVRCCRFRFVDLR